MDGHDVLGTRVLHTRLGTGTSTHTRCVLHDGRPPVVLTCVICNAKSKRRRASSRRTALSMSPLPAHQIAGPLTVEEVAFGPVSPF